MGLKDLSQRHFLSLIDYKSLSHFLGSLSPLVSLFGPSSLSQANRQYKNCHCNTRVKTLITASSCKIFTIIKKQNVQNIIFSLQDFFFF